MANIHIHTQQYGKESQFGAVSGKVSIGGSGTVADAEKQKDEKKTGEVKNSGSSSSIFVGDSPVLFAEQIGQKKTDAQKDALKKILEVFENDLEIDQTIKNSEQHKEELAKDIKKYNEELDKIDVARKELKEEYGITDDCEEEENLNLLRKSLSDPLSITEDEMTKLEEMGQITDYQKAALEYDAQEEVWQQLKEDALKEHRAESGNVQGIKLERLKSNPMTKAQEAAAAIMDAAIETIISLIYEDAKEKLEEKFGGETSDGKVREEQIPEDDDESAKEKKLKVEETQVEITDAQKKILERLKKFIQSQKMLAEDVMGVKVDTIV